MKTQTDTYYVTVTVDTYAGEWDGDEPLDETKTWTPYNLTLYRETDDCKACGHHAGDEIVDSLGGCFASDDMDGRDYLESCIRDHFCCGGDEYPELAFDDLDVRYE